MNLFRSRGHATPAIAWTSLVISLAACSQKSRCQKGVVVEIDSDHPHSATVAARDLERGATRSYVAQGDAHRHLFVLKAEDLQKLSRGERVQTRTTSTNAHGHEVTVRCAP